ncbi:NTP transferase domain-containing protein [bacterium]|nr:NTP transferase domain-containing protein [bacterium]
MNVVVLMSGSSQAFKEAGYGYPKNLAELAGHPMMQHVMESLQPLKAMGGKFICVVRRDENRKHHTGKVLQLMDPATTVIEVNDTSGAACSALLAVEHINNDDALIITNGDQILTDIDLSEIIRGFQEKQWDAGVIVFEDIHPRWSFVKCDADELVIETAEKRPISKFATAGFFYFARGRDFVNAAIEMLKKDAQVNGLFYICPALNEMILRQSRIGIHQIERQSYCSLATPSDVQAYAAALAGNRNS